MSEEFVIIGKHPEPNVYYVKPVNGKGQVWIVNWCEFQEPSKTQEDKGPSCPTSSNNYSAVTLLNLWLINKKHPNIICTPLT